MPVSLAEAAQRVGLHRSNLLRAIKAGRISAVRDDGGAWQVDESELVRVYGDLRSATLQPAQPDALLQLKLEHAEQRCCELMRRAERAEREADEWREQAKRLALPAPGAPHQPAQPAAVPRWLGQDQGRGAPQQQPAQPAPAGLFDRAWRWARARG
jgi:excisionase family DNA binding protein